MNYIPYILGALAAILALCCWYLATELRETENHLTKVKEELKEEKEAQMLEIKTRQFRIAVREPKHIDFSEAFRMVGRDPEEAKYEGT